MKDIYKNPIFYYILIPAVVALWPLLIWGVSLPEANRRMNKEMEDYKDANSIMDEILDLDPERLELADLQTDVDEFDYARAIQQVANICSIPPASYKLSSGILVTTSGQKSQIAKVLLKQVEIEKFAEFLSTIQLRWASLQCNRLKLTKKKALPDAWDIDLEFKYYY